MTAALSSGAQHVLTEDELSQAREAFDLFDKENSGRVLRTEVGLLLRSLGYQLSDRDILEVQTGDLAAHADFSFDKFRGVCERWFVKGKGESGAGRLDKTMAAFEVFDRQRTGYIAAKELKHIVCSLGERMTDEEFAEVLRSNSWSMKSNIPYADFLRSHIA